MIVLSILGLLLLGLALAIGIGFVVLRLLIGVLGTLITKKGSPKTQVQARVVSKRCEREYLVKFEEKNGARREFAVNVSEYEALAEGDRGLLTFRDSKYLKFEKEKR